MIYIIANAYTTSGGPELLHQLCYHLNKNGHKASMVYYRKLKFPTDGPTENIIEKYGKYECPYSTKIIDNKENIVVFPENVLFFLPRFKRVKKVIWWLSVDNYFKSLQSKYSKFYAPFGMNREKYNPFTSKLLHCVQSEYAKLFLLEKGVDVSSIYSLSDYLNNEFINSTRNEKNCMKRDVVLYNPLKGIEYTKKIIALLPEIEWIPLENMSKVELISQMMYAKLYIDFGNHPGKDRIPREAAICGCCIITGLDGAARNEIDIPIGKKYKFEADDRQLGKIADKIKFIISNYDRIRGDFDDYRTIILNEEERFVQEVLKLFNKLVE